MPFDISAHLSTTQRDVRNVEHHGQSAKDVVAARVYDTNAADLWEAVTNPVRITRWFAPVTGEFKLGGRFQIEGNASGTVTACEPDRSYAATWEFGGYTSWIEVNVSQEGEKARVEIHHIAPHPNPHWDQYGAGAGGVGWELGLIALAEHLKRPGDDVRAEGVNGWETSSEAKTFVDQASSAWGRAAIHGGDQPRTAMQAAEATRRFYSGEPPLDA
ncbi:SRPBCC domain-containing protein [Devosia sp. FJ2-5-3]|uniref:SRPBCC domain-containing protein n=1 Tax=Devosia sp. FJ2-5-3 TaxID=2976680 RepID=UPI0023D8048A|nr:SRPBCC domain-containing protein [Devosia sp. FJ2-5-3]WEJ56733.1 SRPBCC domain-containing protein [Devosia sp. FJ2-5-3]